jgi:hypothetical protein
MCDFTDLGWVFDSAVGIGAGVIGSRVETQNFASLHYC